MWGVGEIGPRGELREEFSVPSVPESMSEPAS